MRAGPARTPATAYSTLCAIESSPRYGIRSRVPSAENTGGAGGKSAPALPPTATLRNALPSGAIINRHGPARLLQKANALPFGDVASATSAYGLCVTLRTALPAVSA